MRTIYAINDAGMDVICAHFDKQSKEWIDFAMDFERLRDNGDQTTLILNGKEVTLGDEHFDPIITG